MSGLTDRFKLRFLPWYREKFASVIHLESPNHILAQIAIWYPACGFIWIPIWFLLAEEGIASRKDQIIEADQGFSAPPLMQQLKEAIKKVDWQKVAKITLVVVGVVVAAFATMIAVIIAGRNTCKFCGTHMDPRYPTCPNCGVRK